MNIKRIVHKIILSVYIIADIVFVVIDNINIFQETSDKMIVIYFD